ncbi:MAG: NAD-dependent epimerase/dehydratase family protein [Candidatus Andersenbacteria bacterium]|nr:NAD-dependent epimerase/dehydratase family protein [bacterium]MDZ4225586.1 NAD-dependent epimerase/dehydratase family protein [Candidatus Andersenbacteria bacterium]
MKVLITGGAGFIGAYVAKALAERGDDVVIVDNFSDLVYGADLKRRRLAELVGKGARLIEGSILDAAVLDEAMKNGVDVVLHLAAHANPKTSLDNSFEYTRVNVDGTLSVLEATRRHGVNRVVLAGSSSVYNDEQVPFKEDSYPLKPKSPYGASKAAAEVYCQMWHELYGTKITVLRFFSVYGPWGRPDMAPMIFAERILKGEVLEVNVDERQRDLTYIDDVVPAVLAALDTELDFEVLNIGRGEPVVIRELVSLLERAAEKKAQVKDRPTPPGEMKITFANIDKAKDLLGYEPKISVDEGAKKFVIWLKNYLASK